MKLKTFIRRTWLIILPIVIALFGGVLFLTGSHHQIGNPYIYATISETYTWGKRVDLIDSAVPADIKKEKLEKHLKSYGFEKLDIKPTYIKANDVEVVWTKVAPGFPCEIEYAIILSFDINMNIDTAHGMQNATVCI